MNYNAFIDKLITKTEINSQKWKKANKIPNGVVLDAENTTKIFHTEINDAMHFYLIEYSYLSYYSDFDQYKPVYTIQGSIIEDNIEIESFDKANLLHPYKMDNLMELIIKKYFKPEERINNFLES